MKILCIAIVSVSQCRDVGPFCFHLGYNLSLSLSRLSAIKFRGYTKKNEVCDVEIIALRPPGNI